MAFAYTLRHKKPLDGRFTYLQWLIIISIFLFALYTIDWGIREVNKPPPEIVSGVADGVFDADNHQLRASGASEEQRESFCYNNSMVDFWGTITLDDGSILDYTIKGRRVVGLICLQAADSYTWISSDERSRTEVKFWFKGALLEIPQIDMSGWPPWILIACLLLVIIYLVRRTYAPSKFNATAAKRVFRNYVEATGYTTKGRPVTRQRDDVGGRVFTVGQLILGDSGPWYLILDIDNHKDILEEWQDKTGDVYRHKLGKPAVELSIEMSKMKEKLSPDQVYDQASKLVEEHFRGREPSPKTNRQKAAEVRRLMSQTRNEKSPFPRYDEDGNIIEE